MKNDSNTSFKTEASLKKLLDDNSTIYILKHSHL